ncbi:seryl-tRNA synthetase (serin-tRNA ligase) [Guillardia theta]|uniref:serine--tRNA ligase n=1 Tax=Guillardia theta TaxID=55529 RepID=Q9AW01_GUITH|nr:seryl-tRNA synthetase (serin-tRNA ligase) [Guillardia theta]CAC27070.1 seryl-tRNA synthetase (serin-tRNA ligase) [Guillardia theta]|mmetsp:Transcript_18747/g.61576  ORF Transcript_18747/g.61576 Transcript_18747/m.61576 type:complete len:426 (+) Transcript_18747:11836-13113(+)
MKKSKLYRLGTETCIDIFRGTEKRSFADCSIIDQVLILDIIQKKKNNQFDKIKNEKKKIFNHNRSTLNQLITLKTKKTNYYEFLIQKLIRTFKFFLGFLSNFFTNFLHNSNFFFSNSNSSRVEFSRVNFSLNNKKKTNHVELLKNLRIVDYKRGVKVSGNRAYYLIGPGVSLNLALIQYGLDFMLKRNFISIQTPFYMNEKILKCCVQLQDFIEQLYSMGKNDKKFLIATSEQTICAFHFKEKIHAEYLPLKYVGISTCFRKESGSHGKDTNGIFRVHQFEKIEQFIICNSDKYESWKFFEILISNSKEFYKSLQIPFICINIPTIDLNKTASRKTDLLGWFPSGSNYKELVSCSNCLEYQSENLYIETYKNGILPQKSYLHMLNSTLCATTRTICCIAENYSENNGLTIPNALRDYLGFSFIYF